MRDGDLNFVAPLVVEYYKWLTDTGGTDPETLLNQPLSPSQLRLLLEKMDDVNVCWAALAGLKLANETAGLRAHDATSAHRQLSEN